MQPTFVDLLGATSSFQPLMTSQVIKTLQKPDFAMDRMDVIPKPMITPISDTAPKPMITPGNPVIPPSLITPGQLVEPKPLINPVVEQKPMVLTSNLDDWKRIAKNKGYSLVDRNSNPDSSGFILPDGSEILGGQSMDEHLEMARVLGLIKSKSYDDPKQEKEIDDLYDKHNLIRKEGNTFFSFSDKNPKAIGILQDKLTNGKLNDGDEIKIDSGDKSYSFNFRDFKDNKFDLNKMLTKKYASYGY